MEYERELKKLESEILKQMRLLPVFRKGNIPNILEFRFLEIVTHSGNCRYHPHIAQTVPYHVPEVLGDLLDFSARNLVLGAHLVYWLPTTNQYKHEDLPSTNPLEITWFPIVQLWFMSFFLEHPCLQLISNSEQVINSKFRRRLITMRKVVEYDPKLHADLPVCPNVTPFLGNFGYLPSRMLIDDRLSLSNTTRRS